MTDLGILRGDKLLVFGGVYSNLQALEALKKKAQDWGVAPENTICTGDIIGYCAQPAECVEAIEKWGIRAIQGNVEQNILSGDDDCGCNFKEGGRCDVFSRQWFPYAAAHTTAANRAYLQTLPLHVSFVFGGKKYVVLHGSHQNISEFIFKSTDWAVKKASFDATGADIILAGHCGLPFLDENEGKIWLNAGVIGMPANDGTPTVWYALIDIQAGFSVQFHRLDYDYQTAQALMLAQPLPKSYAQTLVTGLWDNCEILPPTEAQQQGKIISLG